MRTDRGQASVEYTAVAFLVATVIGSAVAITSGGLGSTVEVALRRGICSVTNQRCPRIHAAAIPPDLEACPLSRHLANQQVSLEAGVFRLAEQLGLTVERMSDGRVRVSFVEGGTAGAGISVGAHARFGGWSGHAEGSAEAGLDLTVGRVWVFTDPAAAHRFLVRFGSSQNIAGRLRQALAKSCPLCGAISGAPKSPPKADETWLSGGLTVRGAVGLGAGPIGAKLEAVLRGAVGRRVTHTGTTWFVRVDDRLLATLDATAAGMEGQVDAAAMASIEVDARGVPIRLKLVREARVSRRQGLRLPARLKRLLGNSSGGWGEAIDFESSLNLQSEADRAAAADFLEAIGSSDPRAALRAGTRLASEVDDHGVRTARRWKLSRTQRGIGAGASLGMRLGADATSSTEDQQLASVDSKLPGLGWLPRADCLEA